MASGSKPSHNDYTVAWICALPVELAAAQALLDETHDQLPAGPNDANVYTLGCICGHRIVLTCLPSGVCGTISAAVVATQLLSTFHSIQFALLVGIGGGIPTKNADVRLGDVVVARPTDKNGGVVQYDFGKATAAGFQRTGMLNNPPRSLLHAISKVEANHLSHDRQFVSFLSEFERRTTEQGALVFSRPVTEDHLYLADYPHAGIRSDGCANCDKSRTASRPVRCDGLPVVHYGLIASGNQVIKDSHVRDKLGQELGAYCVEMEAAGLINHLPCLVIRGICDYADSHKNAAWHGYAAATAAANFAGNFVGRDVNLRKLWEILRPNKGTARKGVVIHGMGGLGKTQLAAHFARMHKEDFTSIFWLHGKDETTLNASFADLVVRVRDMAATDSTHHHSMQEGPPLCAKRALEWLSKKNNAGWLLIYDDVEAADIKSWLPTADHGSIIITTRSPQLAEGMIAHPLTPLPFEDALQLLTGEPRLSDSTYGICQDDPSSEALAKRLHGLPLALALAGSYIHRTGMSCSKYLEYYQSQWCSLQAAAQPLRGYPNGNLQTAWRVSYEAVKQTSPLAAQTFFVLSLFHHEDIWYELLHSAMQSRILPPGLSEVLSNEIQFSKLMQILLDFSLVQQSSRNGSYCLHPVIQDWCENELPSIDSNLSELGRETFTILAVTVGSNAQFALDTNDWSLQQRLLYHANRLMPLMRGKPRESRDSEVLSALHAIGRLYWTYGRHERAEQMYQMALAGREMAFGPDHRVTLQTVHNMGLLYHDRGDLRSAELMFERALSGYKNTEIDDSQPEALDTLQSLANIYHAQGRLDEAERLCYKALTGYQSLSTASSPLVLNAMHNLANIYFSQYRLPAAEELYDEALRGKQKSFGEYHTSTLDTIHNIGVVYFEQGRGQEAEEMLFGKDHASVFDTQFQLGTLYRSQGKLKAAEEMYQRVLLGREKVLGACHFSTLHTIHHIGNLYYMQGRLQEAEQMQERALNGFDCTFGHDHTYTLELAQTLAVFCCQRGKLDKAESMFQRVLSAKEQINGKRSGPVLAILNNLANVYREQGRLREAEETYKLVLAEWRKHSPTHTAALGALNNLGVVHQDRGQLKEAEKMFKECLNGYEKELGPNHILTLDTVSNLGDLYRDQHKAHRAKELYLRALASYEETLGPDHPKTQETANKVRLICNHPSLTKRDFIVRLWKGCRW
ncbi:TPR-like protein [Aspergillus neoniger CBS 115656]|uniref:TPR-like protein n=1 Tax=Aspergillus neoniger (strain CBS 115656) TaxID=1448310 RepID=A0A318YD23_ASPNB|nr:TPR-like protein [Aspergillus neoniger CBS 115656]PYH31487.1 TPR-like protein [Aspergillus neoniger CBS 115656]